MLRRLGLQILRFQFGQRRLKNILDLAEAFHQLAAASGSQAGRKVESQPVDAVRDPCGSGCHELQVETFADSTRISEELSRQRRARGCEFAPAFALDYSAQRGGNAAPAKITLTCSRCASPPSAF